MKLFPVLAYLLVSLSSNSQETGILKVQFSIQNNSYEMSDLNAFLTDPNYVDNVLYSTTPKDQVTSGRLYTLSLSVYPQPFFRIGLYGSYQSGGIDRSSYFTYMNSSSELETVNFNYKLTTDALSAGICSGIALNDLLHFTEKESTFIKNLGLELYLQFGMGFSRLRDVLTLDYTDFEFMYYYHKSSDVQFDAGVGLDYPLINNDFFTEIGVKCGYQYFKTGFISNSNSDIIPNTGGEVKLTLDFTGIYFGAYLTFGK